jgi:selenocysteine lyase/cysteine desulfurase
MKQFFPALNKYSNHLLLNNAAGTQIPNQVIKTVNNFIESGYAQPFDNNILSKINLDNINESKKIVNVFLNNNNNGTIVFGNSSSQLMYILSNSLKEYLSIDNNFSKKNIIIADFNHESCITPFERVAYKNSLSLNWWSVSYEENKISINYKDLFDKVNENTELIIIPHVSNILGNVLDIKYIKNEVNKINTNTKLVVDGVAYMPHNLMDVNDTNVDFYVFSFYKLFGLRISCLYIKNNTFNYNIENQNHIFFNNDNYENKLQIGGINYECLASILGVKNFFLSLAEMINYKNTLNFNRSLINYCYNNMTNYEKVNTNLMEQFLTNNAEIKYYTDNNLKKTPIFSFTFNNYSSKYIVNTLNSLNIIIANGSFYSNRLISNLDINETDGVVRASFMNYNYIQDIEILIQKLKYFKKHNMSFNYCINSTLKNKLSENIRNSFYNLPKDTFYENKRYRAFSLLETTDSKINIVGDASFFQSTAYNSFNGNKVRNYENISSDLLTDTNFNKLVYEFKNKAEDAMNEDVDYIFVHQIRVDADNESIDLVPEGIHKDGYNVIGMVCINRCNIVGAESIIFNESKEIVYNKVLDEGEMLIINDNNFYHSVSEINKKDQTLKDSFRDIFVFTTIS